jgi:hypothetical protein
LNHLFSILFSAYIGPNEQRLATGLLDLTDDLFSSFLIEIGNDNRGTFRSEALRICFTYSVRSATLFSNRIVPSSLTVYSLFFQLFSLRMAWN